MLVCQVRNFKTMIPAAMMHLAAQFIRLPEVRVLADRLVEET